MKNFGVCFLSLTAFAASVLAAAAPAPVKAPPPIPKGSIGTYANGCLNSEARLTTQEPGLHKLFVERERWYGNPVMIELLTSLGAASVQQYPVPNEPNQIGDISQHFGGEISRHASHQIGLDVDVVYFRNDHRLTKADRGADASFDEVFVKNGKLTANFDGPRNWWRFEWLYRNARIDRIFMDPAIKAYFCEFAEKLEPVDAKLRTEILRVMRPYEAHDDHFHLRLQCPPADEKCVASEPPPPGDGCRETSVEKEIVLEFEGGKTAEEQPLPNPLPEPVTGNRSPVTGPGNGNPNPAPSPALVAKRPPASCSLLKRPRR